MENKFSFDKIFITNGCSYTTQLTYVKSIFGITESQFENNKVFFNHIGLPSASIKHLKISTISFVDYLLKNGIKNENIYLVGNLTQIGRKSFKYNTNEYEYINEIIKNKSEWNHDNSVGEYKLIKYPNGFCELNGDIFSTMIADSSFYDTLPSDIKKRMATYVNYHNNLSMDELVDDYFSDLLILQEYLKKNKIQYTLFFMNNILEGWDYKYETHKYLDFYGRYEVPDLRNTYNIKNISQQVKSLFDLIDFDNIVCYSNETQTYGGMDEYAIENFKPTDFAGRENLEIKEYYGDDYCPFGHHPLENVQYKFEKKFIYPRIQKFIKKHYENII
jgi:hypothetical protein